MTIERYEWRGQVSIRETVNVRPGVWRRAAEGAARKGIRGIFSRDPTSWDEETR